MQKQNIGNAGEYFIAAILSAENFIVTITLGRAEKYDILTVSPSGKAIKISVKTSFLDTANEFPLSQKDETGGSKDFFYALVRLNKFKKEPDFWIIPSLQINKILKESDMKYNRTLGRNGKKRKSTGLRIIPIEIRGMRESLYPKGWNNFMNKCYKNIKQIKK